MSETNTPPSSAPKKRRSTGEGTHKVSAKRMAAILADAELLGVEKAAKQHGIAARTVYRWKSDLDTKRPKMAQEVAASVTETISDARQTTVANWIADLEAAMAEGVDFVRRACQVGSPKNAMMVQSIVSGLKVLNELKGGPLANDKATSTFRVVVEPFQRADGTIPEPPLTQG